MQPIGPWHASAALLSLVPPGRAAAVFLLMLAASATEGAGIILLVQLLSVIGGGSTDNPVINGVVAALNFLSIPATAEGLLITFVGLIVFQSVVTFAREQAASRLQFSFVDSLRGACFQSLLHAEWRWIAPQRPADLSNLILVEMNRIGVGVQAGLSLLAALVAAIAYMGAALVIAPLMTAIVVITSGTIFLALNRLNGQAYRLGELQGLANRGLLQALNDSIGAIKLSKVLGNESHHLSLVNETAAKVRHAQLSFARSSSLSRSVFQVCAAVLLALYVYVGLRLLVVPLPELLTLVIVFARLMPLLMGAQQQLNRCINTLPAFREVAGFLAASKAARQPDAGANATPLPLTDRIELLDVVVSYHGRKTPALNGLNVTLHARQITTVMGHSGAGKSTLADVAMGLITPDRGALLVDGQAVSGSRRGKWMRSIAYMPQELFLFPGTIRANLAWANPAVDEAGLRAALRRAAADFVLALPHGLDTVIGHSGAGLSGGERQRIALARALLQEPAFLILDEATSALDAANAGRILDAIAALRGQVTVLLIGHSQAAAKIADQVIILRNGELVSAGPWQEATESIEGSVG